MESQQATTTWVFNCGHSLVQSHEHPNIGLADTEEASGICPQCKTQELAVEAIKEKDQVELEALKDQYTTLSREIGRLRNLKGTLRFTDKINSLENTLENLLAEYTLKLLATTEPKTERISKKFRIDLMDRYDDVQWNLNLLLDLETLKIRTMRRNAEYEECDHNEEGKFHYCHATERNMMPEDEVLVNQRNVIREGVKEARDGLQLWKKAYDEKKESPEKFEGAIEDWWKWTIMNLRDAV